MSVIFMVVMLAVVKSGFFSGTGIGGEGKGEGERGNWPEAWGFRPNSSVFSSRYSGS